MLRKLVQYVFLQNDDTYIRLKVRRSVHQLFQILAALQNFLDILRHDVFDLINLWLQYTELIAASTRSFTINAFLLEEKKVKISNSQSALWISCENYGSLIRFKV